MKSAACEKPTVRMRETTWVARDGKEFGYTLWGKPAADRDQPPFAVITIHGLSGAASDFWPVGEFIEKPGEPGPAVYAPELRGQGNDPAEGDRGDIRSPRRWIEDAADFTGLVRARHPGVPVFWIGESLGSLIALHTAAGYPEIGPDGLILLAPIGEFRDRLPTWKYLAVRIAAAFLPGMRLTLEDLAGPEAIQVTSETTHAQQMAVTKHAVKSFTLRQLRAIDRMQRQAHRQIAALRLPLLILYTPNDPVSTPEGARSLYATAGSKDKAIHEFAESYHLILHDTERDTAVKLIVEWLRKRAAPE